MRPDDMWWITLQNALETGWRLAGIHGVGSHGVRLFLQMIEMARKNTGMSVDDIKKLRLTIEHAEALGKVLRWLMETPLRQPSIAHSVGPL